MPVIHLTIDRRHSSELDICRVRWSLKEGLDLEDAKLATQELIHQGDQHKTHPCVRQRENSLQVGLH